MLKFKNYNGLAFIGDPHLWSKKPGYRIDVDFAATVLNKIEQCVDYCLLHNLYPIFLGDLFHTDKENDITLLTKLVRILNKLPTPAATVEGNHEKSQTKLSDDVALSLLRESKMIHTMEKDGLWASFDIQGKSVLVCSSPYGTPIPLEFKKPEKFENAFVFWLSHHDLDFGETYPGVIPLHEIKNVNILVNGHIHKTKPPKQIGSMKAFNPGNITRLSTDCADHIPSIWTWTPENENELIPTPLSFIKNVFSKITTDITIDKVKSIISDDMKPEQISSFVAKMEESHKQNDVKKTDDGIYIKESISALAKALEVNQEFTNEMLEIANETILNIQENE